MQLAALLKDFAIETLQGPTDVEVSALACDSRRVAPGTVFFALPGTVTDGFDFIPQAVAAGACAVIAERLPEELQQQVCYLQVPNVRRTMAQMANIFYAVPTAGIPVIGVTGTNGKTTITYLLENILRQAGYAPAVFGTVEYRFGSERLEASHTTPESLELMRLMGHFRQQGASAMILEVSSHALEQHRVDGIDFDVAIFTNLTPEHLDYHSDLNSYFASKRRLFSELLRDGRAVINRDDGFGRQLLQRNHNWVSFGNDPSAHFHPLDIKLGREGIKGSFATPTGAVEIDSRMIGDFNVSNLLASVAAAQALGIGNGQIAAGIATAPQVPGRLEQVANDRQILALVDYAHSSDALEQVLSTLAKLDAKRRITLVGCGGDRDPNKRPVMAATAARYSDLAIFTSDNPRTEDPVQILEQMRAGALADGAEELGSDQLAEGKKGFVVIPDRREAIGFASGQARTGDLLLVAGKGHEDYQILGREKVHFDDREELALALQQTDGDSGADSHV